MKSVSKDYGHVSIVILCVKEVLILFLYTLPPAMFHGGCIERNGVTVCWASYLTVMFNGHRCSLGPAVPNGTVPPVGQQSMGKRGEVLDPNHKVRISDGLTLFPLPVPGQTQHLPPPELSLFHWELNLCSLPFEHQR